MVQATSESAAAPIGHPVTDNAAIDLQQFCGDDEFRPTLQKPFRYKGHVYATDGRILLRIADNDAYEASDKIAVDKAVHLDEPREFVKAPATKKFPSKKPPQKIACPDCAGRGTDHDCPECSCTCWSCKGKGEIEERPEVSANFVGQIFDLEYIRLMYSLPELEIAPNRADSPIFTPLYFRFAGGVGCLMPMRNEYKIHVDIKPSST